MRRAALLLAAVLVPAATVAAPVEVHPAPTVELAGAQTGETGQSGAAEDSSGGSSEDKGDDGGGPPIWAGIGLILLSAVAGSALARRRNRRRMEQYERER